jgi:hypothetical protein
MAQRVNAPKLRRASVHLVQTQPHPVTEARGYVAEITWRREQSRPRCCVFIRGGSGFTYKFKIATNYE